MIAGALNWINEWHRRACPTPDQRALDVQLGCHIEEFVEMLATLAVNGEPVSNSSTFAKLKKLADMLKAGDVSATVLDRQELLDSLGDQIVTAVGVGYRAKMNVPVACIRVDESNWSKFDAAGLPIFDANGKVTKGVNYLPPNLEGLF